MTTVAKNTSFQWMIDAGVDRMEVLWLERIRHTPHIGHPVALRRIRNMLADARQGLVAMQRMRSLLHDRSQRR